MLRIPRRPALSSLCRKGVEGPTHLFTANCPLVLSAPQKSRVLGRRCGCALLPSSQMFMSHSPHISPLGVASASSYTSVGAEVCVCMTGPEFGTCCALTPVGHGGGLLLLLLPFDRYCLFVDVSSWWFGAHGQMIWRVH